MVVKYYLEASYEYTTQCKQKDDLEIRLFKSPNTEKETPPLPR
jgi:hypothetical protein